MEGGAVVRYLLGRTAQSVVTIFLVLLVVFVISRIAGDPVTLLVGFDFSPGEIEQVKADLGLNDPLLVQFADFVGGAVHGDFGESFRTNRPALEEVLGRAPATAALAALSLVISLLLAIPLGLLAAMTRGSKVDALARLLALIGQAAPSFWLGLMLIFFFSVRLGWFPTGGADGFLHMVLPALTLGAAAAASLTRLTRSAMLEVIDRDYITLARTKGLTERTVILKHAFRNAMIPIITILGLRIGTLLAGSVLVETIFAWPGVGRLIIQSISVSDYPVVQAAILLIATTVVLANLLTDLVYMLIDPRVRYA